MYAVMAVTAAVARVDSGSSTINRSIDAISSIPCSMIYWTIERLIKKSAAHAIGFSSMTISVSQKVVLFNLGWLLIP